MSFDVGQKVRVVESVRFEGSSSFWVGLVGEIQSLQENFSNPVYKIKFDPGLTENNKLADYYSFRNIGGVKYEITWAFFESELESYILDVNFLD